ncbi:MAG: hypothetical protein ACYCT1_08080 [Steroidobacteraceae bacterium]
MSDDLYREDYSHILDRSGVKVTTAATPGPALNRPKAILIGEQVAGVMACTPEEARRVEETLEAGGYQVAVPESAAPPAPRAGDEMVDVGAECDPETGEMRPCDVNTAAETVRGLAEQVGMDAPELDELIGHRVSEDAVIDAMAAVVERMPEDSDERYIGEQIVDIIRSGEPLGGAPDAAAGA